MAAPAATPGTLRTRFQSGIVFNSLGAVFNQGSTFVFNIIAANILGRAVFGQLAMIQTTILMVAQIAQLGCGVTATKYIAEFRAVDKLRAGRVIILLRRFSIWSAITASAALLAAAPWVASSFLKSPSLKMPLALSAAVIIFTTLNGLLMGILAGLEAYRRLALALVISGISYLATGTVLCRIGALNGCVIAFILSALVQTVLLLRESAKECEAQGIIASPASARGESSVLFRFALPASLSGFTTMPALWLSNALLARRADGFSQLAVYGVAYSLMTATLFLPNVANSVGMSLLNFHRGADGREYRRTFWANFAVVAATVMAGAGFIALAGPILLRLFGKDFRDGYPVLLIMMGATVVQGLGSAVYQLIYAQERMWLSFFAIALPRDSMLVLLAYFLAPKYGAIGLASAYVVVSVVAFISTAVIGWRTAASRSTVRIAQLSAV